MKLSIPLFLVIFVLSMFKESTAQVSFGVFADCQYCDCDPAINRYYRKAPERLESCLAQFNSDNRLEFVVGLGDLIDRDFASFERVNRVLAKSENKVYNVAGNHDFEVEKKYLDRVPEKLGLSKTYYSFSKKGWHFIFLNGNEITLNSGNPEIVEQAEEMLNNLKTADELNAQEWNGGMSKTQIEWLEKELQQAKKQNLNVALFCHYPLLPFEVHALWNANEVLTVLEKYDNVKLWLNGHNHAGNYAFQNGIHFVTMHGMVDTENRNSFAGITVSNEGIAIEGFGREPDRKLLIK